MKRLGLWDNFLYMQKIYRKWWFWLGLVILIPVAWYVWGYASWRLAGADSRTENRSAYLGWLKMEADSKALEAQYRADSYGGTTPEETLRLFVEALEKKDYELASKYFVVENRTKGSDDIQGAVKSGGAEGLINAYRKGRVVPPGGVGSSGIYEVELFEPGQSVPFGVRLIRNEFTSKWKILELP